MYDILASSKACGRLYKVILSNFGGSVHMVLNALEDPILSVINSVDFSNKTTLHVVRTESVLCSFFTVCEATPPTLKLPLFEGVTICIMHIVISTYNRKRKCY